MADLSDELLMAFVDGRLDDAEHRRVEAALAADPIQRQRLAPFILTRDALPVLFSEALTSSVPDRLVATVLTAPIGTGASATQRAPEREPLLQRLRLALFPQMPAFAGSLGLAAAVLLIAGLGFASALVQQDLARRSPAQAGVEAIASGTLARALDATPSASVLQQGLVRVRPVLTFVDRQHRYCRQYEMVSSTAGAVGYACRDDTGHWALAFHVPSQQVEIGTDTPPSQSFTPAGDPNSAALEKAVDGVIAGNVLDSAHEARVIATGWSQAVPQ